MPRPIRTIAFEIRQNWKPVGYAAEPYVQAMSHLDKVTDVYITEDANSLIRRFLFNAQTWRGPVARRIKAELKQMVGL